MSWLLSPPPSLFLYTSCAICGCSIRWGWQELQRRPERSRKGGTFGSPAHMHHDAAAADGASGTQPAAQMERFVVIVGRDRRRGAYNHGSRAPTDTREKLPGRRWRLGSECLLAQPAQGEMGLRISPAPLRSSRGHLPNYAKPGVLRRRCCWLGPESHASSLGLRR